LKKSVDSFTARSSGVFTSAGRVSQNFLLVTSA
jgi:hypothetical protein